MSRGSVRTLFGLTTLAVLVTLSNGFTADKDEGWTPLFNGKDLTGWKVFLRPEAKGDPNKVFKVENGEIAVEGSVPGYIITDKEYGNYVLRLQWRWGDKPTRGGRNSGVFVHASGPDKIWPKGAEAQLMADHAGDIWLVDGFKLTVDKTQQDPNVDRHYLRTGETWEKLEGKKTPQGKQAYKANLKPVEKPVGEWNQYEITCDGTKIKLMINGQLVNEGTGAEAAGGKILLQSEGAPIFFRNIEMKPLK